MTESDDLTAIRARVWEVCARIGLTDEQLADAIGVDRDKIAASFSCDRRFSTYELAAIAEHGRTTVEWICGDSDEYDPNARIRAAVEQIRGERQAEPEVVQIRIDLNARTHDGRHVPARRADASGPVKRGDNIIVYEPDDGVATTATVMRCDDTWLHLDVDWDYMVDTSAGYDENSDHSYRDKVNAPLRPETIVALNARLASGNMPTVTVPRRKRQATPERDGYTIGVFLPPGVSGDVRDRLADCIAAMAHEAVYEVEVVGLPGDVLGAVDGEPRP